MPLKDFFESVQIFGWGKTILGSLAIMAITFIPTALVSYSNGSQACVNTTVTVHDSDGQVAGATTPAGVCEEKLFDENTPDWVFNEFDAPDKDGFYCPKFLSGFSSPDIWYREKIPLEVESLQITFEAKNQNREDVNSPAFIFSLGKDPRILRFYVPETSPQLVGFEKINLDSRELARENQPGELRDPIKSGTQTELSVRPVVVQGNNMSFVFEVAYISEQTNDRVEDPFTYAIKTPFSTPEEANVQFGIGTLKGSCIKPIKYEICTK